MATSVSDMDSSVRDNAALHRFELDADDELALAYYRLAPGVMTSTHPEAPPHLQGRGIASELIRGALQAARMRGLKVVPRCSFVSVYLAKHPEFSDLIL